MTATTTVSAGPGSVATRDAGPPRGVAGWVRGYLLMLRFDLSSQRQWLPFGVIMQVLLGAGMAIIYGFYAPHLPRAGLLYLVTGAPAVALIPFGMLAVPMLVTQARVAGTFDFVWSLPVPRSAQMASTLTVCSLIAVPGIVLTLVLAAWRYGVPLSISPMVVPAFLLTALMAASVGLAMAHLIGNPMIVNLITNILVFVVLLYSPISFPLSQFPAWLGDIHQGLPLYHMGVVIRSSLTTGLVSNVGTSYLVLGAWTVAALLGVSWVVGRRK